MVQAVVIRKKWREDRKYNNGKTQRYLSSVILTSGEIIHIPPSLLGMKVRQTFQLLRYVMPFKAEQQLH